MSDDAEKTEEATPERRRKAREEGQFPRAKDTGAVAATLAVLMAMLVIGDDIVASLTELIAYCLSNAATLVEGGLQPVAQRIGLTLAFVMFPAATCAAIAAVAAGFLEAGFEPRLELIAPKWKRIDPLSKLKNLFSPKQAASNVVLTLARVAAISSVALLVMWHYFPALIKLSRAPISASALELMRIAMRFALWATLVLVLLSSIDYIVSKFRHEKSIRMSRQEVKDEYQQQEGDPKVKLKQRQRAREIANRGLVKLVRESDVVIANPTHIAIALRYKAKDGAPVVNAKGYDDVAQHIKRVARDHGIAVVENRALARALAASAQVGKVIPLELYAAVAEVLAFVYRQRRNRLPSARTAVHRAGTRASRR